MRGQPKQRKLSFMCDRKCLDDLQYNDAGMVQSTRQPKRSESASTEKGFSLLEVLIVVGIIMVISTFTVYHAMKSMSGYTLNAEAQQLANSLRLVRMRAIALDRELIFTFGGGTYGISDASLRDTSTQRLPMPTATLTASLTPLPDIIFSNKGIVTFQQADGTVSAQILRLLLTDQRGQGRRIDINRSGLTEVTPTLTP